MSMGASDWGLGSFNVLSPPAQSIVCSLAPRCLLLGSLASRPDCPPYSAFVAHPKGLGEPITSFDQLVQVDASLVAQLVQGIHDIFSGDVACGTGRVGTATKTGEGGVDGRES